MLIGQRDPQIEMGFGRAWVERGHLAEGLDAGRVGAAALHHPERRQGLDIVRGRFERLLQLLSCLSEVSPAGQYQRQVYPSLRIVGAILDGLPEQRL